ncbi:MAG: hypothetical protein M5R40_13660 [Anaerolineae bacterium]|nr:hypothetical protein [Anaerolineae bacterium]
MKQLLNWKTLLLAGLTLVSVMALALGYARVTPVAAAPATQGADAVDEHDNGARVRQGVRRPLTWRSSAWART